MKITKETISKLDELGYYVWSSLGCSGFLSNEKDFVRGTHIVIVEKGTDDIRTFKTPKCKEITVDWVLDKMDKESAYVNLSLYLRKVFDYSISVYPTSYGIGVDNLFGRYKEAAETVAKKLSELGLKYRNEFSDAGWVYRFIVSKDSENMGILESLKSA